MLEKIIEVDLMDNVSVIIRAKDEAQWIGHAIQSVLDNIKKPQIVIVDNNSVDETIDVVRMFQHDPELKNGRANNYTEIEIVNIDDYSPGRALNLGVSKCKNDYILIISSHCVLKQIDTQQMKTDLKEHVCVFGKQIPIFKGKKITPRYLWSHFGDKRTVNMYSDMESRHFLHNALAIYPKEVLIEHRIDENLVGKEDRYWANRMVDLGMSFLYNPSIVADHHYTDRGNTWKGIG